MAKYKDIKGNPVYPSAMKTGTLQELNVQAGDVVECVNGCGNAKVGFEYVVNENKDILNFLNNKTNMSTFRLISRAPRDETPKLWREMYAEEKGALLLAAHDGKVIEQHQGPFGWQERVDMPMWQGHSAYRIKPEPQRKQVSLYFGELKQGALLSRVRTDTHRITFDTINGKPDPASIRMERI